LKLRPLAYHTHPYQWATIGKEISHIEEAIMEDVKAFFHKFYNPSNAILCIAGNFELDEVKRLVEKWYGDIPSKMKPARILTAELPQTEFREQIIERTVPSDAFYYAFKMSERKSAEYYITDMLSDALGRDKSSRLYTSIQKEQKLVTEIGAYITGSLDNGLMVISGKLSPDVTFEEVDAAIWKVLNEIQTEKISTKELDRLKNKIKTAKAFQEQGLLNRAMNLAYFELLGDADGVNQEAILYEQIQPEHILANAQDILQKTNCSLLKVKAIQS
jgi:zinc protease